MAVSRKKKRRAVVIAVAVLLAVLLFFFGRKAWAAAKSKPWQSAEPDAQGYPNEDRATEHFSWAELMVNPYQHTDAFPPQDAKALGIHRDEVVRGARYLERIRAARGDLPFVANFKFRIEGSGAGQVKWGDTLIFWLTPLPGQSASEFAKLVSETITKDAQDAGMAYSLEVSPGDGGRIPVLIPYPVLGL